MTRLTYSVVYVNKVRHQRKFRSLVIKKLSTKKKLYLQTINVIYT